MPMLCYLIFLFEDGDCRALGPSGEPALRFTTAGGGICEEFGQSSCLCVSLRCISCGILEIVVIRLT